MYDIAIIGAGPAGSTLATLIGNCYRILLVDKREYADFPDDAAPGKCCGGLLAPDAQRMLSTLGLGLPKGVLEEPQLFVVKALDVQQRLERYYQRHYININRRKFDGWLLSMVPSSVDIRTACRLQSYSSGDGYFKLSLVRGNKTYVEKARILAGADGAASRVRSAMPPMGPLPKRYFGIQEWVEGDSNPPYFTAIFDSEITDYYCWAIPKGKCLIIGAALYPTQGISEKFKLLKKRLRESGFQFGGTVRREGTWILRPVKTGQLSTGGNGIALLGEAAGWISPSSAEGLSYALKSALILAQTLRVTLEGFEKRYHENTRSLRRNIFLKNLKSHFIFNPVLRRGVMQSGLQSMEVCRV